MSHAEHHSSRPHTEASTLVDLLRDRAQRHPDRPAYTFLLDGEAEEAGVTYGELDARARGIAAMLQGVTRGGERALLLYPSGLEYIYAFFGCLYAGVVPVPAYLPPRQQKMGRLEAIAGDARPGAVLSTGAYLRKARPWLEEAVRGSSVRWLATDGAEAGHGDEWRAPEVGGETLALLQYTSGSTSTPKGVMVTHRNLLHNQSMIQRAFGQSEESVIVGWLPLYHDMGLIGNVIQTVYAGARCVFMSPAAFLQRPARWLEAITRYRATTSGGPNFAYDLCARKIKQEQRASFDLSSWSVAFSGAEQVRAETLERFAQAFEGCGFRREAFAPCYGLAEATLFVSGGATQRPPVVKTMEANGLVGCGKTFFGQRIVVADPETAAESPAGSVGEIWVSGPSVAQGYWNRPEETERSFRARLAGADPDTFLRTGDLGFIDGGELYVTGRLKELIILHGLNHYPQDIELTAERSHTALRPGGGAAFSVEAGGQERLVLVHEVEHRQHADFAEVVQAIQVAVAREHELPVYAVALLRANGLPRTSSGKTQRHLCKEGFLAGTLDEVWNWRALPATDTEAGEETPTAALESAAEIEAWLTSLVARRLSLAPDEIEPQRPLVNYGLDSVTAVAVAHSIENNVGVVLPMASFMQGLSVRELAAKAYDLLRAEELPVVAPRRAGAHVHAEHPLSHGQQSLWVMYKLAGGSAAYNISGALRVRSALDAQALKRAFELLVERHPALRTTFSTHLGKPVARVHDQLQFAWREQDASDWDEETFRDSLAQEAHRPFVLESESPLRVVLFRRAAEEYVVLVVVHHIVADFWSLAVMMRDLGRLYAPAGAEPSSRLQPLALEYTDYVGRQAEALGGAEGSRLRDYWRAQLGQDLPTLNLPTDRRRPTVQSHAGAAIAFRLTGELSERLKAFSRERGVSLYMTLLAAFQVLLHRYSGQDEIVVGSPTAGRDRSDVADLVGYFVNMVALRGDLSGAPTFETFLGRTREMVLSAFEHQDYPLSLLVEQLNLEHDLSRSPVFQTAFVLQKTGLPGLEELSAFALGEEGVKLDCGGFVAEPVRVEQRASQYDLTLTMAEVGGTLSGSWLYSTSLFDAATVGRFAEQFEQLLSAIVAAPQRRLSELSLLSEAERQEMLLRGRAAAPDLPTPLCLHQLFEAQAARAPHATALSSPDLSLSYLELDRRAERLAALLRSRGAGPETVVALCFERSADLVVAVLATLKAGAAYLPLDPRLPPQRLDFMIEDAGACLLLTHRETDERLAHRSYPTRLVIDAPNAVAIQETARGLAQAVAPARPGNIAYIIYTSGSTGQPKAVMVTHANAARLFAAADSHFRFTPRDVWTLFHSYAFDFSVWELWGALLYGGRLVVVPYEVSRTPEEFDRLLRDEGVTVLNQTPSAFRQLLRVEEARAGEGDGGWPALRTVIFGGEALDVGGLAGWFARHGDGRPEMVNMYGITETTVHVTYRRLTAADAEAGEGASPVGTGLSDLEVYVLDERMEPAAVGVGGELYVGGGGVARGYLNRPALTAERFVPHPFSSEPGARLYRTGDRACYRGQGELEFLGRVDGQVKLRGYRIEPGEIEAALSRHPLVAEVAVIPRGVGAAATLVAFYSSKDEGGEVSAVELREHARRLLPDYMVPAQFLHLDRLPLTSSGKVDRRALGRREEREVVSERPSDPPSTPLELLLAEIWCELLDIDEVGVSQNFFELGGHSVLATQLISRLQDLFPTELPLLTMFFQDPTINGLSKAILNNLKDQFDMDRVMETVQRVTELSDNEVEAMLVGDDGEGRSRLLDSTAGD